MEQKILIYKFLITFFLILYSSASFSEKIINGKAKIIDGDTIHIGKNKIRLHGIDAPETNQTCTINNEIWNCGIESTLALEKFVLEKKIHNNFTLPNLNIKDKKLIDPRKWLN